jgi:hypothetical protein
MAWPIWFCQGCGVPLPLEVYDVWCQVCLDKLRHALRRETVSAWGWTYGRSLMTVFAKPKRGLPHGARRPVEDHDPEEEEADSGHST